MLLETLLLRELQQPLGVAHGERRFGGDLGGDFPGARQQRVGLGDFEQDAERLRLLGLDDAPGERELGGALIADQRAAGTTPPPSPAMMPRLTKVSPNCALVEPMRMSHMLARSKPAPIAGPLTAAITGISACLQRERNALDAAPVVLLQLRRGGRHGALAHGLDVAAGRKRAARRRSGSAPRRPGSRWPMRASRRYRRRGSVPVSALRTSSRLKVSTATRPSRSSAASFSTGSADTMTSHLIESFVMDFARCLREIACYVTQRRRGAQPAVLYSARSSFSHSAMPHSVHSHGAHRNQIRNHRHRVAELKCKPGDQGRFRRHA